MKEGIELTRFNAETVRVSVLPSQNTVSKYTSADLSEEENARVLTDLLAVESWKATEFIGNTLKIEFLLRNPS